jgi:hypothetical protein
VPFFKRILHPAIVFFCVNQGYILRTVLMDFWKQWCYKQHLSTGNMLFFIIHRFLCAKELRAGQTQGYEGVLVTQV